MRPEKEVRGVTVENFEPRTSGDERQNNLFRRFEIGPGINEDGGEIVQIADFM